MATHCTPNESVARTTFGEGRKPLDQRHHRACVHVQNFLLGRLMATPGALKAFAATGEKPIDYIVRHMNLDPGVLGAEDQLANLQAVRDGTRVLSAYELRDGTRIWIITEADRSVTTILLPEEY
jgi:hypothetical protein